MIQLIYIGICIGLAYVNYRRIIADRKIYHGLNAGVHFACWLLTWLIAHNFILLLMMPFIARLFFDCSLDLFRGIPLDYVAKKPKSVIDKVEKFIFSDDGLLPKALWTFALLILNILYYG